MSLKEKLARYKQHIKTDHADSKPVEHAKPAVLQDDQLQKAAENLGAHVACYDNETILIKETYYPFDYQHGSYQLGELIDCLNQWQNVEQNHPLSTKGRRPTDLLFFDTETTGLGSGAGHMIFLLCCARIYDQKLQVRQYFLPQPGNEVALYHHFLNDAKDLTNLVTFNGKAFDWPKVKTRHTLIRNMVPKLPAFGHYDLLHASRRLWKNSFPSTNLGTIEKECLGINRKEDVPGHMAPFLYFQYQKHPDAALMDGIFKHNEEDVLSLVTLYIHLSKLILEPDRASLSEQYEIARWYAYIKEEREAISLFEKVATEGSSYRIHAYKQLIPLYKKQKNYHAVLEIIHTLEQEAHYEGELYIEAAKIYEHHVKDYQLAIDFAKKACQHYEQKKLRGFEVRTMQLEVEKRLERIQEKARK